MGGNNEKVYDNLFCVFDFCVCGEQRTCSKNDSIK